jgi:hypothetical protein
VVTAAASSVPASIRSPATLCRTPRIELDALHDDAIAARAVDLRAHLLEHVRELDHLGLARGVLDHRLALGEARGHQHVLRAVHGVEVERDAPADEPRRGRLDIAVVERELGAERAQALQVLIDRPHADRAAAGLGHARGAEAREQGT